MKRGLLFVALLLLGLAGWAAHITPQAARSIAVAEYLRHGGMAADTAFEEIGAAAGLSNQYIFVAPDGHGFVIVSAYDCARKVLAVSTDGGFALPLPDNVKAWLDDYDRQIDHIKRTTTQKASKNGDRPATAVGNDTYWSIGPLLDTRWNQSPYYNEQCPTKGDVHCVTGCVATAMAQIMRYWSYPPQGTGFHTYLHETLGSIWADFSAPYDWGRMPLALSRSSTQQEIDAVATLSFHCGVSVEMDYDTNASSSFSSRVAPALKQFFGYSENATLLYKAAFDDNTWRQMLCHEIDAGRPLFYSGSGTGGGHAFVCDGYDSDSAYHFNWGWGGTYNGFFAMGNLHPSGGGTGSNSDNNFSNENSAIFGLEPAVSSLIVHADKSELSGWGDSATILIRSASTSSDDWQAVCDASWLTLSPTSGSGGGTLSLMMARAEHNASGQTRTATVTITHNGVQHTLTFTQEDRTPSADGQYGCTTATTQFFTIVEPGGRLVLRAESMGNFTRRQQVTAVDFHIVNDSWQFEIEIYEDCGLNNDLKYHGASFNEYECFGTRVYSQQYTAQSGNMMQHVELVNPYNVPADHTFWIVLHCLDSTKIFYDKISTSTPIETERAPLLDSLTIHYLYTRSYPTGDSIICVMYSKEDLSPTTVRQYSIEPHFTFSIITPPCPENRHTTTDTCCTPYQWMGHTYTTSTHQTITRQGVAQNACDSIYELYLESSHYDTTAMTDCESITIGGQDYTRDTLFCPTPLQTAAGCDSMEYVEIHIIGTIHTEQDTSGCDRLAWRGHTYTADTAIAVSGTSSATGCDSIHTTHLHIITSPHRELDTSGCAPLSWQGATAVHDTAITAILHPEGRCDSTVVMNITITENRTGTHDTSVCDTLRWNGQKYTQNVTLPYRTIAATGGCDSVVSLRATLRYSSFGTPVSSNVCEEFVIDGRRYTSSGTYTQRIGTAANGCDSLSTLRLIVRHNGHKHTSAAACDSFVWYGAMLITSGVFDQTLRVRNYQGCDSIEYLHLTLYRSGTYHRYDTACESLTWQRRTARNDTTMTAHLLSVRGCDSIVHMHITIHHATDATDFQTVCDSLVWLGNRHESDGVLQSSGLTNRWGCDSNVTLYLHVLHSTASDTEARSCDGAMLWRGEWHYTSGIYTAHADTNSDGCDSTVRLHLAIGQSSENYEMATADSSYLWHGRLLEASGEYSDTTTDNAGCDSIVHLNLTLEHAAINSTPMPQIAIFAQGQNIVVRGTEGMSLDLYNQQGQLLHHTDKAPQDCRIAVRTKGIYLINISSPQNNTTRKIAVMW